MNALAEEPDRPTTLEPTVFGWLSRDDRERAERVRETVERAEREVRRSWQVLVARWPATAGTRARLLVLARRAATLVEGPRSRLARGLERSVRATARDDEPLTRALDQGFRFFKAAVETTAVIERSRAIGEEFRGIEARFARELPRAWERLLLRRGVTEEAIDGARSHEELDAIKLRLQRAAPELGAWHTELAAWVASQDGSTAGLPDDTPDDAPDETESQPPLAALETRYELLLAIAAVDRGPVLRRNAADLRRQVARHLGVLAAATRLGPRDAMLQSAREYAEVQTSPMIGAEESWTYMEALSHCQRSRAGTQPRAGGRSAG